MRSDRLLHGMHKVYSHDLPNQIVVLQSLLQMLQLEESEHLSKDGQEYVQRLQKVTRRTSQLVRFLKEMGKLHTYTSKPETIALSMLAREVQGTVKRQFPQMQFAFTWQWNTPAIVCDYRTFLHGLTEVFACLMPSGEKVCRVQGTSQATGNQIAIYFVLATGESANDNLPHHSVGRTPSSLGERMEILLATECLAISEGTLEVSSHSHQGASRFSILVPNR